MASPKKPKSIPKKAVSTPKKTKAVPKKQTVKKVVAKKTVSSKTISPKKPETAAPKKSVINRFLVFLVLILLSLVLGMIARDLLLSKAGDSFVYFRGKTWLPLDGKPVDVFVINDENCKNCSAEPALVGMRQNIFPILNPLPVSIHSPEGKKFIKDFDIKGVPAFVFSKSLSDVKKNGVAFVELAKDVLTHKNDLYYLDGPKVGVKFSKFIKAPAISTKNEPTYGDGPVSVFEFTDFQCPYCKRFHDQNKALIDRLILENKITYTVKDFPLGFHPGAKPFQAAANCVLASEGPDAYKEFKDLIFANQKEWSGAGADIGVFATKYATAIGASTRKLASCITSDAVMTEIDADIAEGALYGVSGTPGVFIGTQIMPGAIGPDVFEAAVEAELKSLKQ